MTMDNDHSPHEEVNFKSNKYEYLNYLDTTKLQALLQQESFLGDDEQLNVELIQQIIAILNERDPISEEPDVNASLRVFKEEIVPELENERVVSYLTSGVPGSLPVRRKGFRRRFAAVLVAAIVIMILGSTIIASAAGFNIWEYIISWGKETFQIGSGANVTNEPSNDVNQTSQESANISLQQSYEKMNDALSALDASVDVPTWLPDGYDFCSAYIYSGDQRKSLSAAYKADEKTLMFKAVIYSTEEAAYSYEINESSGESITIEGKTCYLMTNIEQNRIVWIKGNTVYSVNGSVVKDDLIKMVTSIYKGDT